MPIHAPITLPRLSQAEMREIDYRVMAQAFATHRELGRLCDEGIYQADLAERLAVAGLGPLRREFPLTVSFRGFAFSYSVDLVVAERAVYELKAAAALTPAHEAQLLNYLLLANAARGKLINFRPTSVESRFVNAPLDQAERHRFTVHRDGDAPLFSLVTDLLTDWGTGLETALYVRALTPLLGGENRVIRQLPMIRADFPLGNQRFHLAAPDTAFVVTSFAVAERSFRNHLRRLLAASPLACLLWVNISLHALACITIERSPKV